MAEIDSFHCRRCNRDIAGAAIKRLKAGSGEMLTYLTRVRMRR